MVSKSLQKWLQAVLLPIAIVGTAFLLLLQLTPRAVPRGICQEAAAVHCRSGWQLIRSDPYCLIDPVCVSPWYKRTADVAESPYWNGLAFQSGIDDFRGNPTTGLAIPNLMGFLLVGLGLAILVRAVSITETFRSFLLQMWTLWAILEVIRWY
jgi:hypothetical protein